MTPSKPAAKRAVVLADGTEDEFSETSEESGNEDSSSEESEEEENVDIAAVLEVWIARVLERIGQSLMILSLRLSLLWQHP